MAKIPWFKMAKIPCPYCGGSGFFNAASGSTVMVVATGGPMNYLHPGQHYECQLSFDLRPPPLPVTPIEAGEVVGYRVWQLSAGDRLGSIGVGGFWQPGKVMTDRTLRNEDITDNNHAGVWAFKHKASLDQFKSHNYVFGSVWLWGTIIEHELGYRAQYAAIRSLDYIHSSRSWYDSFYWNKSKILLTALRRCYGVGGEEEVSTDIFIPPKPALGPLASPRPPSQP